MRSRQLLMGCSRGEAGGAPTLQGQGTVVPPGPTLPTLQMQGGGTCSPAAGGQGGVEAGLGQPGSIEEAERLAELEGALPCEAARGRHGAQAARAWAQQEEKLRRMWTSDHAAADQRLGNLSMQRHEYWCAQRMEGPPIIFCCRCGAFAGGKARQLLMSCEGAAASTHLQCRRYLSK